MVRWMADVLTMDVPEVDLTHCESAVLLLRQDGILLEKDAELGEGAVSCALTAEETGAFTAEDFIAAEAHGRQDDGAEWWTQREYFRAGDTLTSEARA